MSEKTEKPKRLRPRPCYLQVELTADERSRLDSVVAAMNAKSGIRWNRAAVIREWIRRAR